MIKPVSSDQGENELVRRERRALIPKSLRDNPRMTTIGAEFSVSVYDPATAGKSLAQYLLESKENQFIVLLLDMSLGNFAEDVVYQAPIKWVTWQEQS